MEPLHIRFALSAPVVVAQDYPTHLDGLLSYAHMRMLTDAGDDDAFAHALDLSAFLERATWGEAWAWKASALSFRFDGEREWVNRVRASRPTSYYATFRQPSGWREDWRMRTDDAGAPAFGLSSSSGKYKSYQWLTPVQWAPTVDAWCVGDVDAIRDLLTEYIRYIGKGGNNGWGVVSEVTVEPAVPSDTERWRQRALPAGAGSPGGGYAMVMSPVHPPYWQRTARVPAWVPVDLANPTHREPSRD